MVLKGGGHWEVVVRPDDLFSLARNVDETSRFGRLPDRNWPYLLSLAAGGIASASLAAAVTLAMIPDNAAQRIERLASFALVQASADLRPALFQKTDVAPIQRPPVDPEPLPFEWRPVDPEPLPFQRPPVDAQPVPFQTTVVAPIQREVEYPPPREPAIENVPLPKAKPKPKPVRKMASAPKKSTAHAYAPVECGWDKYKNKVPKWMRKCPGAPLSLAPPIQLPWENFFEPR
jgi:hypothetical protein